MRETYADVYEKFISQMEYALEQDNTHNRKNAQLASTLTIREIARDRALSDQELTGELVENYRSMAAVLLVDTLT